MTISQMMLPEFDHETASTRKMLACVPEEKFSWKPHEKSMTLGRLSGHVAEMANWAVLTINRDKYEVDPGHKPFAAETSAQLMATFEKNAAEARAALEGASNETLVQPWSLVYAGKTMFTMPRAAVLRSMCMNHLVHHRGQLSVYLRLLDVPFPGMYGPSADDQRQGPGPGAGA